MGSRLRGVHGREPARAHVRTTLPPAKRPARQPAAAINLCQISEFSLVVLALGFEKGHLSSPATSGFVSLAFVLLATLSTFGMTQSDPLTRWLIPRLKRFGLRDLDDTAAPESHAAGHGGARILLIGFFRTASSLLEEIARRKQSLLDDLAVVDFNPQVHARLRQRGIRAIYGDVSQPETLLHAGVGATEILVCTIPDSLLKGTTNVKLVRHLRELNPKAKIIVVAEVLVDIPALYAAGASYVSVARLEEAASLCEVLDAADCNLLDDKRARLDERLASRVEVLP